MSIPGNICTAEGTLCLTLCMFFTHTLVVQARQFEKFPPPDVHHTLLLQFTTTIAEGAGQAVHLFTRELLQFTAWSINVKIDGHLSHASLNCTA